MLDEDLRELLALFAAHQCHWGSTSETSRQGETAARPEREAIVASQADIATVSVARTATRATRRVS
jgi:hypothetical protein